MKRVFTAVLLGTCMCIGAATVGVAQENSAGKDMPPKILVINREVMKPGKGGSPHQRTESGFVRAMAAAKDTAYYLGMDAISGVTVCGKRDGFCVAGGCLRFSRSALLGFSASAANRPLGSAVPFSALRFARN